MSLKKFPVKDPADLADYVMHWDRVLNGDTISSVSATAVTPTTTPALTIEDPQTTASGTYTTTWLSGGKAGVDYTLTVKVVTAGGRTLERSAIVPVTDL